MIAVQVLLIAVLASVCSAGPVSVQDTSVREQARFTASSVREQPRFTASSVREQPRFTASSVREQPRFTASSVREQPRFTASSVREQPRFTASSVREQPRFTASSVREQARFTASSVREQPRFTASEHAEPRFTRGIASYFQNFLNYFQLGLSVLFGTTEAAKPSKKKTTSRDGSAGRKVNYKDYQLLRLFPRTDDQLESLEDVEDDMDGVKFWTMPMKNHSADVLVPPGRLLGMHKFLMDRRMEYSVLIKDLQKAIANQNPQLSAMHKLQKTDRLHDMTFKRYHRFADMVSYMNFLAMKYPNQVELATIGKSSMGKPLKVIKISSGKVKNGPPKPIVWIDGGMHAREWISPAVVMYVVKQLVENAKTNKKIVDGADWYVMPVANPDGYEYSHTTDRLWRKTRSNHENEEEGRRGRLFWESSCAGVDANRNWGFHWGERGSSDEPCHETYAGPKAFSEPETKAISTFIMDNRERIEMFLTMHAYSQMWLIPWGFTNKKVGDYDDMMSMGKKAVEAIARVGGTKYDLGSSTKLMYPTSGASDDWAKGVAGIKYAYTVELRDKGSYGFMLPADQIIPTGKETFAAIKALAQEIVRKV